MTFDQTAECPKPDCEWQRTVRVDPAGLAEMHRAVRNAKSLSRQYLFNHMKEKHRDPADAV